MRKSIEASRKAEELEARAASAAASTAISSDDPDAPLQIAAKVGRLKANREYWKQVNRIIRKATNKAKKAGKDEHNAGLTALLDSGIEEKEARSLMKPDVFGNIGIAPYRLRNTAGEIRRLEKRLETLKQTEEREGRELVKGDVRMVEEENRVRIYFPGKPDESLRKQLRSHGFKWARSVGAWQRHASNQAWYWGKDFVEAYEPPPAPNVEHRFEWSHGTTNMRLRSEPTDFGFNVSVEHTRGPGRPSIRQDTLYSPVNRYDAGRLYKWLADSGNRKALQTMDKATFLAKLKFLGARYDYH
jgi:hypothetical protein